MGKSKFARTFRSLTDIGREFNLSARKVGDELKRLGYRDSEGHPTPETLEANIAVSTPLRNGTPHYRWHLKKTKAILAEHHQVDHEKRIRKSLLTMLAWVVSEEYQQGGGIAFKIAEYELFEALKVMPYEKQPERVLKVLDQTTGKADAKKALRDLLLFQIAHSGEPGPSLLKEMIDNGDMGIWMGLMDNEALDDITRQRAKRLLEEARLRNASANPPRN